MAGKPKIDPKQETKPAAKQEAKAAPKQEAKAHAAAKRDTPAEASEVVVPAKRARPEDPQQVLAQPPPLPVLPDGDSAHTALATEVVKSIVPWATQLSLYRFVL